VYARNNAVDIAARLPDGSASELSVSAILQKRTVSQTNGKGDD
jgi:NADH-quinone oxidoreductase subunit J